MKTNSRNSIGLRATLVAFVATAIAFFAYAAASKEELVPIKSNVVLNFSSKLSDANGIQNDYADEAHHFLFTGSKFTFGGGGPYEFDGEKKYYGQGMSGRQVTFKIADGYTAKISVYANIKTSASNNLYLTREPEANHLTPTVSGVTDAIGLRTYTYENQTSGTYIITGDNDAHFCGVKVEVLEEPEEPVVKPDPSLYTISSDYQFRVHKDDTHPAYSCAYLADEPNNKYYTLNIGPTLNAKLPNGNGPAIDGQRAWGYQLTASTGYGFEVGKGTGTITIYTGADANLTLKKGDNWDYAEELDLENPSLTSGSVDNVSCKTYTYTYSFDNTKPEVFWININNSSEENSPYVLAGFDIEFYEWDSVDQLVPLSGNYTWGLNSTSGSKYMAHKIVDSESHLFLQKGDLVFDRASDSNNVWYGSDFAGREMVFDIEAGTKVDATIYASSNAKNFKITDATGKEVAFTTETSDYGITNIVFSGLEGGRYTITGSSNAEFYGIVFKDVTPNSGPLRLINTYYLWRVGDKTIDAQSWFDKNSLRYNSLDPNGSLVPDSDNKIYVLGVPTSTVSFGGNDEFVIHLGGKTKGRVTVYYTEADNISMQTSGADQETYSTNSKNEIADDYITYSTEGNDTRIKSYNFDLMDKKVTQGRLVIIGAGSTARIAAIEVVQDRDIASNAQKNIDWYVCGDSKMIAGSEKVSGNTEYAEFYVSKGRMPRVSFFMPSILKVFYKGKEGDPAKRYKVTVNIGNNKDELIMPKVYGDDGKLVDIKQSNIWYWMTRAWDVSPGDNNTQTVTIEATDPDPSAPDDTEKSRTWKVNLTFHFIDCPTISVSNAGSTATLTMSKAPEYDSSPLFYTVDSTDPADRNSPLVTDETEEWYSTGEYGVPVVVDKNCIALAAQYIQTEKPFYTDGPGSPTSSLFKLMSEQKYIVLSDRDDIIYVKDPKNNPPFKKTAGEIDVLKVDVTVDGKIKEYPVMKFMYGKGNSSFDGAVKFFRIIDEDNTFQLGAVNWRGDDQAQDVGYDTYMDPYQYSLAGNEPDIIKVNGSDVKFNANPNTEMNGGIGGADTEDGGMFLQPVAGDFFRLEPEYDGVATVWVRQNGMTDYSNMFDGELTRRPVYVVDEDGVIQRGSTIKPTNKHHLSVNGVYASASGRNELRASFANAWKYGTTYDEGWKIIHNRIRRHDAYFPMNYEFMQIWFGDILKLKTVGTDSFWYNYNTKKSGGDPNAVDTENSVNLNRFSRIGTQILYRDDWMYKKELDLIETTYKNAINPFAKYGYEIPNFGYVKYYIPVKAGKTYYMGGRGTKNGFVAMQFEPLPPNYDNRKYQRIDNPNVIDDKTGEVRPYLEWTHKEPDDTVAVYRPEEIMKDYEKDDPNYVRTLTIKEDGGNQDWWNWWPDDKIKDQVNKGDGMLTDKITINVDLYREFEAGKWYPIVLPFSVSESRMKEMFGENVKVLYLDPQENSFTGDSDRDFNSVYRPAIEGTQLKFTYHCYQMLYANTPAFICPSQITEKSDLKSKDGDKTVFHFRRVCFVPGSKLKDYAIGGGYKVTGSYAPTFAKGNSGTNGEMYYISNENGKVVMYHSRNGIDMKGTRCWIVPINDGVSKAPIMTMGFGSYDPDGFDDSGTTGVTDVISDDAPAAMYDNDNVYDIMGRIVAKGSTAGLPKGVYIFKGKKVYVK